jgi:hypothetical protein
VPWQAASPALRRDAARWARGASNNPQGALSDLAGARLAALRPCLRQRWGEVLTAAQVEQLHPLAAWEDSPTRDTSSG